MDGAHDAQAEPTTQEAQKAREEQAGHTADTPYLSMTIFVLSALLACSGLEIFLLPSVYQLASSHNLWLHYEGQILISLSVLLVLCRRWLIEKLRWLSQGIHRIASALLMVGVIGIDAMMHLFNVPHMEGWWLPLFGSGAAIRFISGWIQGRKK